MDLDDSLSNEKERKIYETKSGNETNRKMRKEGDSMTLTKDDLQAIQVLLLPINERLYGIDGRFDRIELEIKKELKAMDERISVIEQKVSATDARISVIEQKVSDMDERISDIDQKVSDTYELALDGWGKSTENRRWLEGESRFAANGFR